MNGTNQTDAQVQGGKKEFDLSNYRFRETPMAVKIFIKILKYVFLIACCLIVIIPLLVVLIGAFKTHDEYISTNVFQLPAVPQFENFKIAFLNGNVLRGLANTAIILVVSTLSALKIPASQGPASPLNYFPT